MVRFLNIGLVFTFALGCMAPPPQVEIWTWELRGADHGPRARILLLGCWARGNRRNLWK